MCSCISSLNFVLTDTNLLLETACIIGAVFIGALAPVQALLNRFASTLLPSKIQTTWWSFAVGDIFAIIVFIVEMILKSDAANEFEGRIPDTPIFTYFGGVLGAIFIASTVIITGIVGSAPFFVCIVCGQIIGSVIIEQMGAMGATTRSPGIMRIFGR